MNKKHILVAAILFFSSSSLLAADWRLISSSEKMVTFMDMESIKKDDSGLIKSWVQVFYRDGKYAKFLALYNCKNEESGPKAVYSYKSDGSRDFNHSSEYVEFSPVAPDTTGYTLLKISCSESPESELQYSFQERLQEGEDLMNISKKIFKNIEENKTQPTKKKSTNKKS